MNSKALKKIEAMLAEAAAQRTWGEIQVDLKDGKVILIRQIIQTKINEEYPGATVSPTSSH